MTRREPGLYIGGKADPYLKRWYIIPRNAVFNIYLHRFCRSDDDRALHDHPWINASIILDGEYVEVSPDAYFERWPPPGGEILQPRTERHRARFPGDAVIRWPTDRHRVLLRKFGRSHELAVTTIFITGPRVREWGFWCGERFVHWQDFTAGAKGELVGKGCGE